MIFYELNVLFSKELLKMQGQGFVEYSSRSLVEALVSHEI